MSNRGLCSLVKGALRDTLCLKQKPIAMKTIIKTSRFAFSPARALPVSFAVSFAVVAALLFCAGCVSHAPTTPVSATTTHQVTTKTGAATVLVTFSHPENFTDVKSSMTGTDNDRDSLLEEMRDYVVAQAPRFLGGGQVFSITFNDIDMAGDFEPWRGPSMQDVRIIKEIYPPRIALDFSLKNAAGAEIASGSRNLTDLTFMSTLPATVFRDDRLRHEKTLLFNWLSGELARLASGGAGAGASANAPAGAGASVRAGAGAAASSATGANADANAKAVNN